jgi:hypothetical protein
LPPLPTSSFLTSHQPLPGFLFKTMQVEAWHMLRPDAEWQSSWCGQKPRPGTDRKSWVAEDASTWDSCAHKVQHPKEWRTQRFRQTLRAQHFRQTLIPSGPVRTFEFESPVLVR